MLFELQVPGLPFRCCHVIAERLFVFAQGFEALLEDKTVGIAGKVGEYPEIMLGKHVRFCGLVEQCFYIPVVPEFQLEYVA